MKPWPATAWAMFAALVAVGADKPVTSCDLHVFVDEAAEPGLVVAAGRLRRNVAGCRPRVGVDRVIGEVGAH